jgi:hypothetical protein
MHEWTISSVSVVGRHTFRSWWHGDRYGHEISPAIRDRKGIGVRAIFASVYVASVLPFILSRVGQCFAQRRLCSLILAPIGITRLQTKGVREVDRPVRDVSVVVATSCETDRVLADKSLQAGVVVPRPIVTPLRLSGRRSREIPATLEVIFPTMISAASGILSRACG